MIEINAAGKIIISTKCAAQIAYKCRSDYMAEGQQPECARAGDRRFKWAFSLYVPALSPANLALPDAPCSKQQLSLLTEPPRPNRLTKVSDVTIRTVDEPVLVAPQLSPASLASLRKERSLESSNSTLP
jgi:hypothetical protein